MSKPAPLRANLARGLAHQHVADLIEQDHEFAAALATEPLTEEERQKALQELRDIASRHAAAGAKSDH